MAEFVNLENDGDSLNVVSPILETVETVPTNNDIYTIDTQEITTPEEVQPGCTIGCCDPEKYYGDADPNGSFKKINLFSELVDEYQRAVARRNLGIGDEYSLLWGNIYGNISNQTDLINYIATQIAQSQLTTDGKLEQLLNDLTAQLSSKADITSPNLLGTPTTTLPPINDNSSRIASTEWVNLKIENSSFLSYLTIDKDFMFYGDAPVSVTCSWDYSSPIESQKINGLNIPLGDRSYTFTNVNSYKLIQLSYVVNGVTYTKSISFQMFYPIYYGTSQIFSNNEKTKDSNFVIDCPEGEYAYILLPLNNSARIAVDNIVGGFENIGTTVINGVTFYIYKSVNFGLGKLYITIL